MPMSLKRCLLATLALLLWLAARAGVAHAQTSRPVDPGYFRHEPWRFYFTRSEIEHKARTVTALLEQLRSAEPESRIAAVQGLADVWAPPRPVVEALVATLRNDPEYRVRVAAAEGLEEMAWHVFRAIDALIEAMASQDDLSVATAIQVVGNCHHLGAPAIPAMARFVTDPAGGTARRERYVSFAKLATAALAKIAGYEGPGEFGCEPEPSPDSLVRSRLAGKPHEFPASEIDQDKIGILVKALGTSLRSSDAEARLAAVSGLVRIGPAAAPAAAALGVALTDPQAEARVKAATALARIGPSAKTVIEPLVRATRAEPIELRRQAIRALALIGPSARQAAAIFPPLIQDRESPLRNEAMAALALIEPDSPRTLAVLLEVLYEGVDANGSESAARSLASMPKRSLKPLIDMLADPDPAVAAAAARAIEFMGPAAAEATPPLVKALDRKDPDVRKGVCLALSRIGPAARDARSRLLALVATGKDWEQPLDALLGIGLDESCARVLGGVHFTNKDAVGHRLFEALVEYPAYAMRFLGRNPYVIGGRGTDLDVLCRIVADADPKGRELRAAVLSHPAVPAIVMGWSFDRACLPALQRRIEKATAYRRIALRACARACGAKPDRIVRLSEDSVNPFRPPSGWPGSDKSRGPKDDVHAKHERRIPDIKALRSVPLPGEVHWDGWTEVVVTGRLRMPDGTPPGQARIRDSGDYLLLPRMGPERFRYDPADGRFLYVTRPFGAYLGDGHAPHQTGPAIVTIEADGAGPLKVSFWDEMPEVEITLTPVAASQPVTE